MGNTIFYFFEVLEMELVALKVLWNTLCSQQQTLRRADISLFA